MGCPLVGDHRDGKMHGWHLIPRLTSSDGRTWPPTELAGLVELVQIKGKLSRVLADL